MTRQIDQDQSDHARVVALPVLIYGGFLVLGILVDNFWPMLTFDFSVRLMGGAAFICPGVMLFTLSFRQFREKETTVNPYGSVSVFIRSGPFKYSRNPMYVAFALIHLGLGFGIGGLYSIASLVPALAVMHYGVIQREEAYLERKFGEEYLEFKAQVRRWL